VLTRSLFTNPYSYVRLVVSVVRLVVSVVYCSFKFDTQKTYVWATTANLDMYSSS